MGWTFPWASSFGSDFNFDFNVSFTEEQQREGASNTTTGASRVGRADDAHRSARAGPWPQNRGRWPEPTWPRTRARGRA